MAASQVLLKPAAFSAKKQSILDHAAGIGSGDALLGDEDFNPVAKLLFQSEGPAGRTGMQALQMLPELFVQGSSLHAFVTEFGRAGLCLPGHPNACCDGCSIQAMLLDFKQGAGSCFESCCAVGCLQCCRASAATADVVLEGALSAAAPTDRFPWVLLSLLECPTPALICMPLDIVLVATPVCAFAAATAPPPSLPATTPAEPSMAAEHAPTRPEACPFACLMLACISAAPAESSPHVEVKQLVYFCRLHSKVHSSCV